MRAGLILAVLLVAGCVSPSARTIYDHLGREVTIVDTGIDPAGGTRLTTIGQFGDDGRYNVLSSAQGPGTAQTVLPSVLAAAGFVGGMHLLQPAEFNNQTSVNATNAGITAASNPATKISASTASNNAGGSATGGTASGSTLTSTGGQGGAAGQGGAGGSSISSGGSSISTSSPTVQNQPVTNSSATSSPMLAPVFSPVITGGQGGTATSTALGGQGGSAVSTGSSATGGNATATGGTGSCQGNCQ